MQTARDKTVWKVRVLIKRTGWEAKTFFYSREFNVDRWKRRAGKSDNIRIDFIGKYNLEDNSAEQDHDHHGGQQPQGQ
ncbi:hypothetical protein PV336_16455 [Streptomyces sp. MI02-2A]|uniref:hypothetical protein n=1 Tax=Streptomyces sp. MI02-2A TaxID=3028688 RepID=UPI0029A7F95A|nr:hypothetical protein [Streptomyces sp. MI02-2A]MDX3260810.1 hypothetical protein [Streptomyces sp. MI02-2A]